MLPKLNENDLEDLPQAVRDEVTFVPVDNIARAIQTALEEEGAAS